MNKKELIVYFSVDLESLQIKQCNMKSMINTSFQDFFNNVLNNTIIQNTKEEFNINVLEELLKEKNTLKTFYETSLNVRYVFDINSFDDKLVFCSVYKIIEADNMFSSNIDYLTGIYNRAYLTKEFASRVKNNKFKTCALILIDLNNFKNVNDYFGHRVGDKVLREFTNQLAQITQDNLFGRYGGDEFIVFLEDPNYEHIYNVCKQILDITVEYENNKHSIKVNSCLGVTLATIEDAQFEYLLEKADKSLYKSKQAGKMAAFLDDECLINIRPKKFKRTKQINKKFRLLNQEINHTNRKYLFMSICIVAIFIIIFIPTIITLRKQADETNFNEASNTMLMLSEELEEKVNTNIELYFSRLNSLTKVLGQELDESIDEKELLSKNKDNYYFENVGFLYESGDILFDNGSYNISQERIAEEIIINKKAYIDNVYFNFAGEYILVGVPFVNDSHESILGLCGVVATERFSSFLKTNVFNNQTRILITDNDGTIISSSTNYTLPYKNINNLLGNSTHTYKHSEDEIVTNSKETISVDIENEPSLLYLAPINLNKVDSNLNWKIVIFTPTSVINMYTSELYSNFVYLFTGVVLFLIIIIGAFLAALRFFKNKLIRSNYIDQVTDGINLKRFNIDGEKLITQKDDYALVISDIVRFKYINEQFGRQVTDEMLKQIYKILLDDSTEDELISRIYGDRFVMLINNGNIINRINKLNQKIVDIIKKEYGLSINILYGIYSPEAKIDGMYYATNMARIALKALKNSSSESILSFYSKEMYIEELSQIELEQKFDSAIRNHEFLVYYQAKRDIQHETWHSSEALVRWKDSDGNIISPGKFIPLFEANGYITTLDLYIFEVVCKDLKQDINKGIKPLPVSINLSKKHLLKENFINDFAIILKNYDIPSDLIEFEFTESMAIENIATLNKVIDDIHSLGCKCSIDDFGTGYSSLSMLSNFQFDVIKLDRSFFYKNNLFSDTDKIIIKTIIELAHNLNKTVVAEGIEELDLVNFLKQCKCDCIQGFYYAKPIDRSNFIKLIEN